MTGLGRLILIELNIPRTLIIITKKSLRKSDLFGIWAPFDQYIFHPIQCGNDSCDTPLRLSVSTISITAISLERDKVTASLQKTFSKLISCYENCCLKLVFRCKLFSILFDINQAFGSDGGSAGDKSRGVTRPQVQWLLSKERLWPTWDYELRLIPLYLPLDLLCFYSNWSIFMSV